MPSKNLLTLCHRFISLVVYSFKHLKQVFDLTSQECIHTQQSKSGMGSRLNCFDEAENLKEIPGIFDWHPIKRPPFPLKGRPNSLVTSYPNPGWGNRILLRERPAHQCRNGSDLSILFASDAPTDPSRFRGPCHLPLLALGEVSAFRLLGP